mmetsp:Transcript_115023/g.245668  ORF Transcript_115023/g.245668 Transcript_115023/m.245668 type:complete len:202 (-) Transcript_115023:364-969(-)
MSCRSVDHPQPALPREAADCLSQCKTTYPRATARPQTLLTWKSRALRSPPHRRWRAGRASAPLLAVPSAALEAEQPRVGSRLEHRPWALSQCRQLQGLHAPDSPQSGGALRRAAPSTRATSRLWQGRRASLVDRHHQTLQPQPQTPAAAVAPAAQPRLLPLSALPVMQLFCPHRHARDRLPLRCWSLRLLPTPALEVPQEE